MHKLLILYDVPGWAFHRRALALQKYAPADFDVTIAAWPDVSTAPQYDLVFQLDNSALRRFSDKPHVFSWNSDPNRRQSRWERTHRFADWVICNNLSCWNAHRRAERTCCISNGVDTDVFRVTRPIAERPDRIFWTGSSNPAKKKGFDILQAAKPELERLGFEVAAFPVESAATAPFDTAAMVEQYNSSGYVLCLSESEATPNIVTEGAACGCAVVSTPVGNVTEWGTAGLDWWTIENRSIEGLVDSMIGANHHRRDLAISASLVMDQMWSYGEPGNRAAYFFSLFRALIELRDVRPFAYNEVSPEEI